MSKAMIAGMLRETDERYRAIFFTEWDARVNETNEITRETVLQGTDRYRVGELFAGLTTAPQKAEGSNYDFYAPQEGNEVIVGTDIYKFAFRATEELRDYGRSNQTNEYARIMAEIMDHTVKVRVYNKFNRAFNASYPTHYNNTQLISTTQPLANGGAATNRLATDADPSEETVEGLIELMLNTPNEDGVFIGRRPAYYMTSTAAWATNIKITNSAVTTMQGSGESGNAVNAVVRAWNIVPHFSPFLTDDDASFLLSDRSPVNVVWARKPELKPVYVDPNTDDWVWRIKAQFNVIADTWRGVVGTSGS